MAKITSSALNSWRTTLLGVLAGIAVLLPELQALLDANPETVFNVEVVIAGLGMMGIGVVARDNSVSSEQAGAS